MKYMGSKAKIASEIIPIMTKGRKKNQYFVDLFCGGCNLIDKVTGPRIANDINKYIIAMWYCLQKGIQFPSEIPKSLYDAWRTYYNQTKKNTDPSFASQHITQYGYCGWVGFMGSFNGRFYDGGYSGHNVVIKSGKTRDYIGEQIRNTLEQIPLLQDVKFISKSYEEVELPDDSIIYCDIPYKDVKQYDLSRNFDYDKFYKWCWETASKGFKVFISEYNMPHGFKCVWEKEVTTTINQIITKKPVERLFVPDI